VTSGHPTMLAGEMSLARHNAGEASGGTEEFTQLARHTFRKHTHFWAFILEGRFASVKESKWACFAGPRVCDSQGGLRGRPKIAGRLPVIR